MKRSAKLLLPMAVLPLICLIASQAQAAARSYSQPTFLGQSVDYCLSDGTTCGKPAADVFCRTEGYHNALSFRLQHDPRRVSTSITIDSGRLLRRPRARPFQMVKCWRPNDLPSAVQFGLDDVASPRLCDLGKDCRKSAADQWCERKGYHLGASAYEIVPEKALFRTITCATL
jgi:hypothetical protein